MFRQAVRQIVQRKMASSVVEYSVLNTSRQVLLNRPKKLNALNSEMLDSMLKTVSEYSKSDVNSVIVLHSSAAPRAFCAGGDVADIAVSVKQGAGEASVAKYFGQEYSLNWLLAGMKKPVVAMMDGITMGGGVGLAIHVPFRVATENTLWAMPETEIGLYPDVGTTFALPRIVGLGGEQSQLGFYLCLTSDRLSGIDAYLAGLASHYVSHSQLESLRVRLGDVKPNPSDEGALFDSTNKVIEAFSSPIPEDHEFVFSNDILDVIEKVFTLDTPVEQIKTKLSNIATSPAYSSEVQNFAKETHAKLAIKSPVSMEVTRAQFRRNSVNDIQSALHQDLITSVNMVMQSDLTEYSSAVVHKLVEKKNTPYPWKDVNLTLSQLSSLIAPKQETSYSLLDTNGVTFKDYKYHKKYSLPSEASVRSYITGSDESGRSLAVTKKEAINYFTNLNPSSKGKSGVKYLVSKIIDRKCEADKDGFLTWKYQ